jgi:hypothetical protein
VAVFPLGFFVVQLNEARRTAKREFGTLASCYVNDFRQKWIGDVRGEDPLLGTADIQSLADLANSYATIKDIRLLPMSRQDLLRLVGIIAFPFLPLVLTMFSLEEVIKRLFKLVF